MNFEKNDFEKINFEKNNFKKNDFDLKKYSQYNIYMNSEKYNIINILKNKINKQLNLNVTDKNTIKNFQKYVDTLDWQMINDL